MEFAGWGRIDGLHQLDGNRDIPQQSPQPLFKIPFRTFTPIGIWNENHFDIV
jgi:hypothetical protein